MENISACTGIIKYHDFGGDKRGHGDILERLLFILNRFNCILLCVLHNCDTPDGIR